jgi:hypothetical protein
MKNKQDMTLADFKYQIKITTKLTKCGQDTKIFLTMEYFGKDHGQIRKDYANREFEYQDKKFVAQTSFIVKDYEDFDIIEKQKQMWIDKVETINKTFKFHFVD